MRCPSAAARPTPPRGDGSPVGAVPADPAALAAGRTAQAGDPRAAGRSLLDRRNRVRATQDRVNPLLERPLTLARPFGGGSMSTPEPSS